MATKHEEQYLCPWAYLLYINFVIFSCESTTSPTTVTGGVKICYLPQTGDHYPMCHFSSWLPWDCTHCTNNWSGNPDSTTRKRALCGDHKITLEANLQACGLAPHSDTETNKCVTVCPLVTSTLYPKQGMSTTTTAAAATTTTKTDKKTTGSTQFTTPNILHTSSGQSHVTNIVTTTAPSSLQPVSQSATSFLPKGIGNSSEMHGSECNSLSNVCFVGPWEIQDNPKYIGKLSM